MHVPGAPFAFSAGPRTARIAMVGEAWGEMEEKVGQPFIGASGQELTRMLDEAGIARSACFLTNVFALRPLDNKIENLCVKKGELPPGYTLPPVEQGKYIHPQYLGELSRLKAELEVVRPNLIVALGNKACWGLLAQTAISRLRGVVTDCVLTPGIKVLPTYHPAGILRNWENRVVAMADLLKAKREMEFSEIRRPHRQVLVDPTLGEIEAWATRPHSLLSVDIETKAGMIECVGFARSRSEAMVVPFIDRRFPGASYWPNEGDEIAAWRWVQYLLDLPCPKLFQNGLYDISYFARMGLTVRNATEDTMLLHHSLFPELQKGLGFLGSIYTSESGWKIMRGKTEALKADE